MNRAKTEETIFCDAMELPPQRRAEFVRTACAGDRELQLAVNNLLQINETDEEFLATPAVGLVVNEMEERPGQQIGSFQLEKKLGEGGFGVVWLANQQEPIQRRVAVKIVKLGMDSENIIRRFNAERQSLAMMNHPNIATVLDAGVTPSGRPFFAMELVEGQSLKDFLSDHEFSLTEQLQIFVTICRAVQHAHQKGIVHRDLKPSNIMVSSSDGQIIPKVIDFGIAVAIQDDQTERTAIKNPEPAIGTPLYMSPEQWHKESDIDTRSDIYSLGVVLYQLLSGSPPDSQYPTGEQDFIPPSQWQHQNHQSAKSERPKTNFKIAPDLDWIVSKAMQRKCEKRYQSASELAADIERFLDGQVVLANPGGRSYQLKKLIQRNKIAVGSAAAILAMLLVAIFSSTWGYINANRQRMIADEQREIAEHQKAVAEQEKREVERLKEIAEARAEKLKIIANVFLKMLPTANPVTGKDSVFLVRENLAELTESIDQLVNEPEIEVKLRFGVAQIYYNLSRFGWARLQYNKAQKIRTKTLGEHHPLTLQCLAGRASCNIKMGKVDIAENQIQTIFEHLTDPETENRPQRRLRLVALNNLRKVRDQQHRYEEAYQLAQDCLKLGHKVYAREPKRILDLRSICAISAEKAGDTEQAEVMARDAVQDLVRNFPRKMFLIANAKHRLAEILLQRNQLGEAKTLAKEVAQIQTETLGENDEHVIRALILLAQVHFKDDDLWVAEQIALDATARADQLPISSFSIRISANRQLALILSKIEPRRAAEIWSKLIELHPSRQKTRSEFASDLTNYAKVLNELENYKDAAGKYQEALEILESLSNVDVLRLQTIQDYAKTLRKLGKTADAKIWEQRAQELLKN